MKTIKMKEIVVDTKYGTSLIECMQEAIVVAIVNGVLVTFEFNGDNYRVHSVDLLKTVKKIDEQ